MNDIETIRIEIPIETVDETDAGIASAIQGMKKLEHAINNIGKAYDDAEKKQSGYDKSQEKTQKKLAQWAKEKYEVLLEAKEKISPILSRVGGNLKSFAGKTWSVAVKAKDLATAPIKGILNLLKNPLLQAGAVLGVGFSVADSVNTFKDFEAAMSQVSAVSGATGSDLEKLTEKAKEMGATTKFTATESAEAFNYMAMAGWKTTDILDGIESILNLAAASGEALGTTSDIVTDALTAFGLAASDSGHFADVLAAASSNANTNVSMMGETFKYAGSMAGSLGYSIEDVALMTGLMANNGIKASMSGTALNSIFTRLSTDAGASSKSLGALGVMTELLGVEFYDAKGNARDLSDMIDELRAATKGLNDEDKSYYANKIAGTEAQKGLLAILNASEADYKKLKDAINDADGAAAHMADTMINNLEGSLTLLQSAVDGVKNSLGERLSPYVGGMAKWLTGQMPEIEAALSEMMDWVDGKVEQFKKKVGEMTSSGDWQNADFFGKVKIAWDELIEEPFGEWWETTGKAMIAEKAGGIGNAIGTGISTSLLMLLGIDVSGSIDEGVSIGKSFAKGFTEGFDFKQIQSKLMEGLGNMIKSAGKLLPGGESVDMSSLISAFALSKMAKPALTVGKGAFDIGKVLFGDKVKSGASTLAGKALGSFSLDAELAGTGMAGGSGIMGLLGNAGMGLGSTASTGAGMAAVGGGAVVGTVAAGATIVSGLSDFKVALDKNTDAQKSKAYGTSGAMKFGGVAAGAAAGAAIGSVVPVLGTAAGALIGAGIGGIGGWLAGNSEKKQYEQQMKERIKLEEEAALTASKAYTATGRELENVRLKSEALNAALKDSSVSAEQFASMYREAVNDKVQSSFGNIHLSLKEIKDIASELVLDGAPVEQFVRFADASADAKASLDSFQGIYSSMSKLNWKAGLGFELESGDIEEYKAMADNMFQTAKEYINNKHFEAAASIQLLMGDADSSDMIAGIDSMYGKLQGEITSLQSEMTVQMNLALRDGVLSINEEVEIQGLMEQIKEVTDRVSSAETAATLETLKIKYGGSEMDAESFAQLQQEIQCEVESLTAQYDEALKVGITNLELEFPDGGQEFEEQMAALKEAYHANIEELQVQVESFQLETIAGAFESDLDGILPDIEGTTAEKLAQAIQNAVDAGINPATWDVETAAKFLGLEGLDTATQDAIIPLISSVAETMPDKLKEAMKNAELGSAFQEGITSGIEMFGSWDDIMTSHFEGAGAAAVASLTEAMEAADMSGLDTASGNYATYVDNSLQKEMKETGKSAGAKVPEVIGTGIGTNAANVHPGVDTLCNELETYTMNQVNSLDIVATPKMRIQWDVVNDLKIDATVPGSKSGKGSVGAHANGGFINGKQLSWIGEEGPEAIIPLVPGRRNRALKLFQQTAKMLGISAHAEGGFVGGGFAGNTTDFMPNLLNNRNGILNVPIAYNDEQKKDYDTGSGNASGGTPSVNVNVNMSPEINITQAPGQDVDSIMEVILNNMEQIADKVGEEIAGQLMMIFGNMA